MLLKNTICCIIQSPKQTTPRSSEPWLLQKQLENEDVAILSLEKHLGWPCQAWQQILAEQLFFLAMGIPVTTSRLFHRVESTGSI